jgi:hypothetical protein
LSLYREAVFIKHRLTLASPAAKRELHVTVRVVALAIACIAVDLVDANAFEPPCDERRPHSSVERDEPWVRANERAERAGRGRNHRALAGHLRHGCLVAEASKRGADAAQCSLEPLRGTKLSMPGELSTERDPDLVQAVAASAVGQDIDNKADQLLITTLRKLDRRQFWSHAVGLGRSPGARARSSCPPFERGNQETRLREPLEAATGNVAVDPLGGGDLVGRYRLRLGTGEEERLAKFAIADRVKSTHHF